MAWYVNWTTLFYVSFIYLQRKFSLHYNGSNNCDDLQRQTLCGVIFKFILRHIQVFSILNSLLKFAILKISLYRKRQHEFSPIDEISMKFRLTFHM